MQRKTNPRVLAWGVSCFSAGESLTFSSEREMRGMLTVHSRDSRQRDGDLCRVPVCRTLQYRPRGRWGLAMESAEVSPHPA